MMELEHYKYTIQYYIVRAFASQESIVAKAKHNLNLIGPAEEHVCWKFTLAWLYLVLVGRISLQSNGMALSIQLAPNKVKRENSNENINKGRNFVSQATRPNPARSF